MTQQKNNLKVDFISLFAILLFSIVTYSCDPGRVLKISTGKDPGASVTIYCNQQFISRHIKDTLKTKIIVPYSEKGKIKNDTVFFFGIGTWSNDSLLKINAKLIDSIIFENKKQKKTLTNQDEISKYLLEHRKGAMKNVLEISPD
jgi:hypothetical protein